MTYQHRTLEPPIQSTAVSRMPPPVAVVMGQQQPAGGVESATTGVLDHRWFELWIWP